MKLSDAPIRQKLTMVIMLTSAVALFLSVGAFTAYEIISFRKNLLQTGETISLITAAQTSAAVDFGDPDTAQDVLSQLRTEPTIIEAAVYDKDGKILAWYPARLSSGAFPQSQPAEARFEAHALRIFQTIKVKSRVVGVLYIKWDLEPAYARIRFYSVMALCVVAGSLIIALVVSDWLQARISGPILGLAQTARAVSQQKDYAARATKISNDELGELVDAFNYMLTQIEERDAAVRALNAELEQRVQARTAELQAANRELEAFTYSVSHDLRSPLRHINAYAEILEEEHATNLSAEAKKCLERIRQGVENMGKLVDDLLNLSRVARADLQKETVALGPLVQDAMADLRMETRSRNIEWRIGALPSAYCDAGLVKQVFANLLSNAVKYSRTRSPAVIEVGLASPEPVPVFSVRDNGVGFNMKYASKLFGVFQRLHRPDEFEGTGIGLATVQRIVQLHGGQIWAEAELDKGAAFYFTLAQLPAQKEDT